MISAVRRGQLPSSRTRRASSTLERHVHVVVREHEPILAVGDLSVLDLDGVSRPLLTMTLLYSVGSNPTLSPSLAARVRGR